MSGRPNPKVVVQGVLLYLAVYRAAPVQRSGARIDQFGRRYAHHPLNRRQLVKPLRSHLACEEWRSLFNVGERDLTEAIICYELLPHHHASTFIVKSQYIASLNHAAMQVLTKAWRRLDHQRGEFDYEPARLNLEGIEDILIVPLAAIEQLADKPVVSPLECFVRIFRLGLEVLDGIGAGVIGNPMAAVAADPLVLRVQRAEYLAPIAVRVPLLLRRIRTVREKPAAGFAHFGIEIGRLWPSRNSDH